MNPWAVSLWTLAAVAVATVLTIAVRNAKRIDLVHRRVASGRIGLNRLLVKRASEAQRVAALSGFEAQDLAVNAAMALELAQSGVVTTDLGTSLQTRETQKQLAAQRLLAESALSRSIDRALTSEVRERLAGDPVSKAQLAALDDACYRVQLGQSFYNQDVALALTLRSRRLSRALHLAGVAARPEPVSFDG